MYDSAATADHADALRTGRRAKSLLCLLILLALLIQLAAFFTARYGTALPVGGAENPSMTLLINYLLVASGYVAILAAIALPAVLMLLAMMMLTSRTAGVARVVSAFCWSMVLLVMLFPWQSIFLNPTVQSAAPADASRFVIPGVLYSWSELSHPELGAKFDTSVVSRAVLRWSRYAAFPLVALAVTVLIHIRSGRAAKDSIDETLTGESLGGSNRPQF